MADQPTTPPAAPGREILPRRQPETLRLQALHPTFTVDDLQRSLAFYVDGLGFTIKERWEPDGELRGVMLVAGRCEMSLTQDDWAKGRDRVKGVGFRLYAETAQDLDAIAERLRARGIAADGPRDSSWGARVLNVTDPDGFQMTLTQELG